MVFGENSGSSMVLGVLGEGTLRAGTRLKEGSAKTDLS